MKQSNQDNAIHIMRNKHYSCISIIQTTITQTTAHTSNILFFIDK